METLVPLFFFFFDKQTKNWILHLSVLNISKTEIDCHKILSYNNFHLLGFSLPFWHELMGVKILWSFKKIYFPGLNLRGSGGLRFERDHYKTRHHQSNHWDPGVHGVPFQPCGNRPISSNLAIVTEADKESIKSTSIYAGLSTHLGLFQGRIWKRSRTMWQMSKIHSFVMWTVQRKIAIFPPNTVCLDH